MFDLYLHMSLSFLISVSLRLGPTHLHSHLCSCPGDTPPSTHCPPSVGPSGRITTPGTGAELSQSCSLSAEPRQAPGEEEPRRDHRRSRWEAPGPGPWETAPTQPRGSDISRKPGAPDPGDPGRRGADMELTHPVPLLHNTNDGWGLRQCWNVSNDKIVVTDGTCGNSKFAFQK